MNSFPKVSTRLSFAAVAMLILAGLAGCGNNGHEADGGPVFNEDTVKNHIISIDQARLLTRTFRASIESFNHDCASFKDSLKFGHAEEFPADVFKALLVEHNDKQGMAKGIRIYYGRGVDGEIKLVMVPVDSLGNDMIGTIVDLKPKPGTEHVETLSAGSGQAAEQGQRCPTLCDDGSSGLN